jgi:probable HAF family extracellular repeat protein
MQDLGFVGSGPSPSRVEAHAISADGSVVAGMSSSSVGNFTHGFLWTDSTGMVNVSPQVAYWTLRGISDDGAVAVGDAHFAGVGWRACRWDAVLGVTSLGEMPSGSWAPSQESQATAVSADGQVIVGYDHLIWSPNDTEYRGFVWTRQSGFTNLGHLIQLADLRDTQAKDVSADGSVVVGWSVGPTGKSRAFRWTTAGGMTNLGTISGLPLDESFAWGISADGAVIVGGSGQSGTSTMTPFRWTASTGMQPLPTPGGAPGIATATNADGSVVVGTYLLGIDGRGFRWTATGGTEDLGTLGDRCLPTAVSADGSIVVGTSWVGLQRRAFRWSEDGMGARYCAALPNSTGQVGRLAVYGNNIVANNQVQLAASNLPQNSTGYFIASLTTGNTIPINSQGRLCLGSPLKRFAGPGQVLNSGAAGAFAISLDLTSFSSGLGVFGVQPGDTWYFQAWHRDPGPPTTTNLTDAVGVTFR